MQTLIDRVRCFRIMKKMLCFFIVTTSGQKKKHESVADHVARKNRNVYNALSSQPYMNYIRLLSPIQNMYQFLLFIQQHITCICVFLEFAYCAPQKIPIMLFSCKKVKFFYFTWYVVVVVLTLTDDDIIPETL